jgi:hypothetical protein
MPVLRLSHQVLGEQLAGFDVHQLLPQFAAEHEGKVVAVDWQSNLGWQRFLWCRK